MLYSFLLLAALQVVEHLRGSGGGGGLVGCRSNPDNGHFGRHHEQVSGVQEEIYQLKLCQ